MRRACALREGGSDRFRPYLESCAGLVGPPSGSPCVLHRCLDQHRIIMRLGTRGQMIVAGIDVSKETLQAHVEASPWDKGGDASEAPSGGSASGEDREFSNDRRGFRSLRTWLRK